MTLGKLKKSYNKALSEGKDVFVVDGKEFLVSYARYLIEYLSTTGLKENDVVNFV